LNIFAISDWPHFVYEFGGGKHALDGDVNEFRGNVPGHGASMLAAGMLISHKTIGQLFNHFRSLDQSHTSKFPSKLQIFLSNLIRNL